MLVCERTGVCGLAVFHLACWTLTSAAVPKNLWVVMPYFAGGSVLNIMKYNHPTVRCCAAVVLVAHLRPFSLAGS